MTRAILTTLAACGGSEAAPDAGPTGSAWYVHAEHRNPDFAVCMEELAFDLVVRDPGTPGYVEGFEDIPCDFYPITIDTEGDGWGLYCLGSRPPGNAQVLIGVEVPMVPPHAGRLEIMESELTGDCTITYDITVEVE